LATALRLIWPFLNTKRAFLFIGSAVGAVAITWYCIISFTMSTTAENPFTEAYVQVSSDPFGWYWSQMLLSWTVTAACISPTTTGTDSLKPWQLLAFLILGELIAISGAFPLFFIYASGMVNILGDKKMKKSQVVLSLKELFFDVHLGDGTMTLVALAAVGQLCVFITRVAVIFGETTIFEFALACLHLVVLAPAIFQGKFISQKGRGRFLGYLALMSTLQHWISILMALSYSGSIYFPIQLLGGLFVNRCQLSIGVDGILAHFQGQVFHSKSVQSAISDTMLAVVFSPGSMFAVRSGEYNQKRADMKDKNEE